MGKVLKEGRKRESGNGDAMMPVGSCHLLFFSSLARLFSSPLLPSTFSPRSLHRRLKSCPRNFKRNYFGSLSSSLYRLLRANSRWHLRAQPTYSPKIPKYDGLLCCGFAREGNLAVRIRDWWIRRSCLTIVSYKFLNEIGISKPDSRRDIPMLTMLGYSLWTLLVTPRVQKLSLRFVILLSVRLFRIERNNNNEMMKNSHCDPSKTRQIIDQIRSG